MTQSRSNTGSKDEKNRRWSGNIFKTQQTKHELTVSERKEAKKSLTLNQEDQFNITHCKTVGQDCYYEVCFLILCLWGKVCLRGTHAHTQIYIHLPAT